MASKSFLLASADESRLVTRVMTTHECTAYASTVGALGAVQRFVNSATVGDYLIVNQQMLLVRLSDASDGWDAVFRLWDVTSKIGRR